MLSRITAAALATFILSSPASAWDNPPSNTQAAKAPQDRLYCIRFDNESGSRLSRTLCKTKEEWENAGVDVDSLGNK
jgi:hypothetical protein